VLLAPLLNYFVASVTLALDGDVSKRGGSTLKAV